jgi:histidinol-phosphatase
MDPSWQTRYSAGLEAAKIAGQLALRHFDTNIAVETKADLSPVTVADRDAEQSLRERLGKLFPGDGFLGEEFGDTPGSTGFRWIIDPIDGTRSFIRDIPIWATLVSLEYRSEQIMGICYMPAMNLMYRALRGDGAFRDDRRIHVSDVARLDKALVSYSSLGFFKVAGKQQQFLTMLDRTERSRAYSDFYGFMLVAQGSVDLMVEQGVHIWDVAGLKVIVEEAGGTFTNWDGNPSVDRPDVVASNGKVHAAALEILRS